LRYFILVLIVAASGANAGGVYVQAEGAYDQNPGDDYNKYDSHLVGTLEMGVSQGDWDFYARHTSYLQARDLGRNVFGVRHRAEWELW